MNNLDQYKILKINEVATFFGVTKSTIHRWTNENSGRYRHTFPKKALDVNGRGVGFYEHEIIEYAKKLKENRDKKPLRS